MSEILTALVIATVVTLTVRGLVSLHRGRRETLREYRNRFYDLANKLVESDSLDDADLLRLQKMATDLDQKRTFWALWMSTRMLRRDIRQRALRVTGKNRPKDWPELLFNYYIAITYGHAFFGWMLRSELLLVLDPRFGPMNAADIDDRVHTGRLQAI